MSRFKKGDLVKIPGAVVKLNEDEQYFLEEGWTNCTTMKLLENKKSVITAIKIDGDLFELLFGKK